MDGIPIENGHFFNGFSHEKRWIFPSFFVCLPQGRSQLDFPGPGTTTSGAIPTASRIPRGPGGTAWDGAHWGPGDG